MADTTPVLDLFELRPEHRPTVKMPDGNLYEFRTRPELTLPQLAELQVTGNKMTKLYGKVSDDKPLTMDQSRLVDNICRSLLRDVVFYTDLPDELLNTLTADQMRMILESFTSVCLMTPSQVDGNQGT